MTAPAAPAAPPRAPGRRAWTITLLIVVFIMISSADKAVLGFAQVPITDDLGLSNSAYGLIASSFFILFNLASLLLGVLAGGWSSRWVMVLLALGWSVSQLPVVVQASVATLLIGRVLLGGFEGPSTPMSMHALYTWFPDGRRGLPSSLHLAGAGLGVAASAPFVAWIIDEWGWRAAFLALSVVSLLWCLAWIPIGRDGPYVDEPLVVVDGRGAPPLTHWQVLRTWTCVGAVLANFGAYWAVAVSIAWFPAYLEDQLGYDSTGAAGIVSTSGVVTAILLLTLVPLSGRLRARGMPSRWSRGAMQGATVGIAGLALLVAANVELGKVSLLVLGFSIGTVAAPLGFLIVAEVTPVAQRSAVFGAAAAIATVPGLLAPAVTGWIIDAAADEATGYSIAFTVGGLIILATGIVAILTVRPERDALVTGVDHPEVRTATPTGASGPV